MKIIKEQGASGLLSSLEIKAPGIKILLVGLFSIRSINKLIQI